MGCDRIASDQITLTSKLCKSIAKIRWLQDECLTLTQTFGHESYELK